MKKIILILLFLVLASKAEAYILDAGDVYIQDFSNLPYVDSTGYTGGSDTGLVSINMKYNLLDAGEIIRLEGFENIGDTTPFDTWDFNTPTNQFGICWVNKWQDLNGKYKLTMLSGSVNLDVINVQVVNNGDRYYQSFPAPSAVPEPSSLLLMGFGGIITAFIKRRRKA